MSKGHSSTKSWIFFKIKKQQAWSAFKLHTYYIQDQTIMHAYLKKGDELNYKGLNKTF